MYLYLIFSLVACVILYFLYQYYQRYRVKSILANIDPEDIAANVCSVFLTNCSWNDIEIEQELKVDDNEVESSIVSLNGGETKIMLYTAGIVLNLHYRNKSSKIILGAPGYTYCMVITSNHHVLPLIMLSPGQKLDDFVPIEALGNKIEGNIRRMTFYPKNWTDQDLEEKVLNYAHKNIIDGTIGYGRYGQKIALTLINNSIFRIVYKNDNKKFIEKSFPCISSMNKYESIISDIANKKV